MPSFQQEIKDWLKRKLPEDIIYLKERPQEEIFSKHEVTEEQVQSILDMKKIRRIYPHESFPDERVAADIENPKGTIARVIILHPNLAEEKHKGKVCVITAFPI